ncbi:T9SS type A sorting domain-containing protein [Candidatus Fermentibacteria bacterium]|nr:T9SS type A sorting domain-containing protein [Candidatus Fermentibacteria bacterium]
MVFVGGTAMRVFPLVVAIIASLAYAGYATQTDWSGGPGVLGPVIEWGDEFFIDTGTRYYNSSCFVSLDYDPVMNLVKENSPARSLYSCDIDGDEDLDLLTANGNEIKWWENLDGTATSWIEHTVAQSFSGACAVYAEDVDGDGDTDVLGAARQADEIAWWENQDSTGTNWMKHGITSSFDFPMGVHATDIDGDGYMDVLGAADNDNEVTWWKNEDGSGTTWTEHTIAVSYRGANSVYSEDIDDDGDMDVLSSAFYEDDVSWWENDDGQGTSWTPHSIESLLRCAADAHAEDVNGDGAIDVIGAGAERYVWWENNDGHGTSWIEHTITDRYTSGVAVYATDIDSDGDTDILCGGNSYGELVWWENADGNGVNLVEHIVEPGFDGANSVYAVDLNGDGKTNVVASEYFYSDYRIAWWDVTCYSDHGSLESSILDLQESPDWKDIDWTSTEPIGTSITFQVRASDDPGNMGAWSDTLTSPGSLEGVVADRDSFFQYRAILSTSDPDSTPVLQQVMITWEPLPGVQGEAIRPTNRFVFHGAVPNPALGTVVLSFVLPADLPAKLSVFDLSGRLVERVSREFPAGNGEVRVSDLEPGVYFVRISSGGFKATRRLVVIE